MKTKQSGNLIAVRLDRGEELVASLQALCEELDLCSAIVTGIGAAKGATVCMFNMETGQYANTELPQFLEITNLSGNVTRKDGKPYLHLHITLADGAGNAFGGHLKRAVIGATAELFLLRNDLAIERKLDAETGLNLIEF